MPFTSLCTRVASLSISGVPPFNGFFSKLLITIAVVWAGHWVLGGITVLVSFMTLVSFTKVQRYLIEGEVSERNKSVRESPMPMLVSMGVLAALCLAAGLLIPFYRSGLLDPAGDALMTGFGYAAAVFAGG
jgi:multicomponent Na+:H+ antiporter subunit D